MSDVPSSFDLSNHFGGFQKIIKKDQSVYLTQDSCYSVESQLNEADQAAETDQIRYTEDEVFSRIRRRLHARKDL